MKARELLHGAVAQLHDAGCDAPRRDAELLLMHVWRVSHTSLIIQMMDEVPQNIVQAFEKLLQRRLQREPLAYILGVKEFWAHEFLVSPDVLVPRPETEHLIESVLKYYPDKQHPYQFCDIGTGSGCIAVTLAKEYPNAQVTACDISKKALAVAEQNARHLGVSERMHFFAGDLYQALPAQAQFDVIVSNPPYVSVNEMKALEPELLCEPRFALTDEASGLTLLEKLLADASLYLMDGGMLMLESGLCGMPVAPQSMVKVEDYQDLAANFRGTIFRKA